MTRAHRLCPVAAALLLACGGGADARDKGEKGETPGGDKGAQPGAAKSGEDRGGQGGGAAKGGEQGEGGRAARPKPAVQVAAARGGPLTAERVVTGTLAAVREARLLAQVDGAVLAVLAEEGDRVRRGEPLARLDATIQQAEASAARAGAATARANLDRTRRLFELGAASRAAYEQAAAQAQDAESRRRIGEQRAGYGIVRSPFDGVVSARAVDAGDVAATGQLLLTVSDTRELRAEVPVSELDVVALRERDAVSVLVDAFPERPFTGRIRRVFPTVDPVTRQALVEVVVSARGTALRPGLLSRITLTTARVDSAVAVPVDAVRRDVNDRPYVFVLAGDTLAVRRPVVTGITAADNQLQVTRGLRAGERVIVSGLQQLGDTTAVRVVRDSGGRGAVPGQGAPTRPTTEAQTGSQNRAAAGRRAPGGRGGR